MPFVLMGKVVLPVALTAWVGHLATGVGSSGTLITQIVSLVTSLTGLVAALAGLVVHLRHRDSDVVYIEPHELEETEGKTTIVIPRDRRRARDRRRRVRVRHRPSGEDEETTW